MIKKEDNVSILTDFMFKLVFGRVASKELLEDFLERIINIKVEIDYIANNEIVREMADSKSSSLDLVAITKKGGIINIEVQNKPIIAMEKRIKYYSDKLGVTMLSKGEDYQKYRKIISVAILNHKLYKQKKKEYINNFKMSNSKDSSIYNDNQLEITIFEKMKKENYNINNPIDRTFMYLYGLLTNDELTTVLAEDNLIKKIEEAKNMISKSKEAEILKIEIEKRQMDEKIRLETAKEKGIKEGKEEGIKEGVERGKEEGKEEEKINFALKLKNKGFSLKEISEMTELSFEKLKNLISNT